MSARSISTNDWRALARELVTDHVRCRIIRKGKDGFEFPETTLLTGAKVENGKFILLGPPSRVHIGQAKILAEIPLYRVRGTYDETIVNGKILKWQAMDCDQHVFTGTLLTFPRQEHLHTSL